MTVWGEKGEESAFRNMLTRFPGSFVACVSDSYDLFHAVSDLWGGTLKADVIKHGAKGGCLVIRPDSGDPCDMVVEVGIAVSHDWHYQIPVYKGLQGNHSHLPRKNWECLKRYFYACLIEYGWRFLVSVGKQYYYYLHILHFAICVSYVGLLIEAI